MTAQPASPRQALRARLLKQRQSLSAPERLAAARGLRHSLEQLPDFLVDTRVAGYWASAGELPLNLAIAPLTERGQTFYLPIIQPQRQLHFVPWAAGTEVAANRHGIPEPTQHAGKLPPSLLDLVLVPLLGFDRRGHRLGFGGGYYDASFAFLRDQDRPASPLLVGIGYAFQELDDLPAEAWDVPLDYIATDRELIDCHPPQDDA